MNALAPLLVLAVAASATPNEKLAGGISAYRSGDRQGALVLLLGSLDEKGTRAERGRARLYVGLIQHDAGSVADAEGSFSLALRLAPRLRLPTIASASAEKLFKRVQTELGIKQRVKRTRRTTRVAPRPEPPRGPNVLEPLAPGSTASTGRRAEVTIERNTQDLVVPSVTNSVAADPIPTATWVLGAIGVVLTLAAATFAIATATQENAAFDDTDRESAEARHNTAYTHHGITVAGFAAAGLSFGAAAVALTF